jgi:hypothetical protein
MTLEQYQDIWVKGSVKKKGVRECESRWNAIKPIFDRWSRPFTVLDFGANLGYYSLRLVEEYDCHVVAVESVYAEWLKQVLDENDQSRIMLLDKKFTLDDIKAISEVEHFDAVLALSVMHHIEGGSYEEILEAMRSLGDVFIAEVAVEGSACGQDIVKDTFVPDDAEILAYPPSHLDGTPRTLFTTHRPKSRIYKSYLGTPLNDTKTTIVSKYNEKYLIKNGAMRYWHNGINLRTFLDMGGCVPSADKIASMCIASRPDFMNGSMIHGDITVHNVILQGDGVKYIDSLDVRRDVENDDFWFEKMIKEILDYRR